MKQNRFPSVYGSFSILIIFLITGLLSSSPSGSDVTQDTDFNKVFTGNTFRVDTIHSGSGEREEFSLDRMLVEGPWAGCKTRLTSDLNLGKYRFRVWDKATASLIFSKGYCSIFGEWETTGEATGGIWKSFSESFIFPEPRYPFSLAVEKRRQDGSFQEIWKTEINPESRFTDRSTARSGLNVWTILENGPCSEKVDLLIMGDGYRAEESEKFHADAKRLSDVLFSTHPFDKRKKDFNVRAIDIVSQDSGISDPRGGSWKNTALSLTFNALDLDRYVLTFAEKDIRDYAAAAPYDFILLLFNDSKYGGGGIFNLWMTCSSDAARAPYVFVHEFGHLFAGLADEYYSSDVAYENFESEPVEPWEPNVTALKDPENLKWKNLVEPSTPLPTPWSKQKYDSIYSGQSEGRDNSEKLSSSEKKTRLLSLVESDPWAGKVGAFEGAAYRSSGMYRPELACTMFSTQTEEGFCRVCRQAIERMIDLYTGQDIR